MSEINIGDTVKLNHHLSLQSGQDVYFVQGEASNSLSDNSMTNDFSATELIAPFCGQRPYLSNNYKSDIPFLRNII